jgi:hypothetical protein
MQKTLVKCLYWLLLATGLVFSSCKQPIEDPPKWPLPTAQETNGPLTDTNWSAFASHIYSGSMIGDWDMDPSNRILINSNTTTLIGDFWGSAAGTHSSYYSENNPNFVMPTAPRIFVLITANNSIEIIQGGQSSVIGETGYGTIVWVSTTVSNGDRADIYFRSSDKSSISEENGSDNGDDDDNGAASSEPVWQTSTFTGSTTAGYGNGTGLAARFSAPQGIMLDTSGYIYVADTGNNCIRLIQQVDMQ